MSNFRKAPRLYHIGKKDKRDFYLLPKNLMDSIFGQLNGKQGNQIKLMSVLLGTAGDGRFAVSERWICDRTGMDQTNYSRARKALIDRGWLQLEDDRLYVDYNAICNLSDYSEGMSSETKGCNDSMETACADNMHNKEKQNNINKIIYNHSFSDSSENRERRVPEGERTNDTKGISRNEEINRELEWIDLELKYQELVAAGLANKDVGLGEYKAEEERDDVFDLDSILADMFEEGEVDASCYEEESDDIGNGYTERFQPEEWSWE